MKTKKLVYGVGINDADYVVKKFEITRNEDGKVKQRLIWSCPFHQTWKDMLRRCYSIKSQDKRPTYIGCSVSEEWKTFSNFRAWMERQDWEGMQLDKDLLIEGNKVYSKETCAFVTRMVNSFITDKVSSRGDGVVGVCWDKNRSKFMARCCNPFTKKPDNLGRFTCEQEAHQAWLNRKLELAKELASIQTDPRIAKALIERYSNYKANN